MSDATIWRRGFEALIGDAAEEIIGHAYADLSDAVGSLQLVPTLDEPYSGLLTVVLYFDADETGGVMWPRIARDPNPLVGGDYYQPIEGSWPEGE